MADARRSSPWAPAATSPSPAKNMLLSIALPEEKAGALAATTPRIMATGSISHAALESVIGRLSFAQTSGFGWIGRCVMAPSTPNYGPIHTILFFPTGIPPPSAVGRRPSLHGTPRRHPKGRPGRTNSLHRRSWRVANHFRRHLGPLDVQEYRIHPPHHPHTHWKKVEVDHRCD